MDFDHRVGVLLTVLLLESDKDSFSLSWYQTLYYFLSHVLRGIVEELLKLQVSELLDDLLFAGYLGGID